MPPRRRREADAVLVSSGMRNPPRCERGFRYGRRHLGSPPDVGLSRDGVQGAPRPARQRASGLQPALPVASATRVPEAPREGRHLAVRGRCQPLLRRVGPRPAWPTQVGHGVLTHAEPVVARRPRSAATRCDGRRNRQGLLSASSGVERLHSRARIDTLEGVPVRRYQVAEVDEQRRGPEKRTPAGNGWRGRGPGPQRLARALAGEKALKALGAAAKPR